MKTASKSVVTWAGMVTIALLQAACQQAGTPASTNSAAETNSTNASASAAPKAPATPAAPAPAAPTEPDASMATGPLAMASDSTLPPRCQEVVREAQSCLDNLRGDQADRPFREQSIRRALDSNRRGWPSYQDDSYRTRGCEAELATMRAQERGYWNCRPR